MTFVSLFVAMISVISQIAIPLPSAVPITLQMLMIAFVGYYLEIKLALVSVLLYIALGAVGAPVFASFNGGFYVLLGPTGGFIWGFIIIAVLCAISAKSKLAIPIGILSVIICHFIGAFQYMLIAKITFLASIIMVSLPYILKDIIFVPVAYFLAGKIKKRIDINKKAIV